MFGAIRSGGKQKLVVHFKKVKKDNNGWYYPSVIEVNGINYIVQQPFSRSGISNMKKQKRKGQPHEDASTINAEQ